MQAARAHSMISARCLLLVLSASGALVVPIPAAQPAPAADACTVIVIHPQKGPAASLSFEGKGIGVMKGGSVLEFQLPAGASGRLRAGNGGGVERGSWPIFYSPLTARKGETIHLLMELKLANTYGVGAFQTGTGGQVFYSRPTQQVTEGRFRPISAGEATRLSTGLKRNQEGLVKVPAPEKAPTPTRR